MRLMIGATAAMFSISAATSAAGETMPGPVAASEVLAQVVGSGEVHSPPQIARFRLTVIARADSAAAARAACDAALRDVTAKLRDLGVPDREIMTLPVGTTQFGSVGNESFSDDDSPNPAAAAAVLAMARQRKTATVGVQIALTDMSRVAAVRRFLLERDDIAAQPPTLSLRDDGPARREAISQAIAKAQDEANAYASTLGMRVARVARVFDPAVSSEQMQLYSQMASMLNGGTGNEVVTTARVGMDVVLAPR